MIRPVGRYQLTCYSKILYLNNYIGLSQVMTTISTDNKFLTLINVFTVAPENQQRLIDLLVLATDGSITKIPGFISSGLHRSLDGTKVTMYAQWRSPEDYNNMRNNPQASPYLTEALKIADFDPGMYEVVRTFLPIVQS
jgi:hypothetical protein